MINVLWNFTDNFIIYLFIYLFIYLQLSDGELAFTFVTGVFFPLRRPRIKCVCACYTYSCSGRNGWWSVSAWSLNPFSVTVEYPSCMYVLGAVYQIYGVFVLVDDSFFFSITGHW